MSEPVSGNHNDLYNIKVQFEQMTATLEETEISVKGLFMNADAEFDSKEFRDYCEKKKFKLIFALIIETECHQTEMNILIKNFIRKDIALKRTNAWMDSFRILLNRFDTTVRSLKGLIYSLLS